MLVGAFGDADGYFMQHSFTQPSIVFVVPLSCHVCVIWVLQVVLCGQSYDATAALFTTSMQHPAVKGCVALYPFWYVALYPVLAYCDLTATTVSTPELLSVVPMLYIAVAAVHHHQHCLSPLYLNML